MLQQLIATSVPELLITYTRNPRILRMVARTASALYPVDDDSQLTELATSLPNVTMVDGVAYHLNRYGEQGLFRGEDPASRPFHPDGIPLKQQFTELISVRNALAVVARTRRIA